MLQFEPDSSVTQRLLQNAASGDQRAFVELMERHRRRLRRFVRLRVDRRLRSRIDPSDVVQEAQLEAFRRLDDYLRRRPMPFRVWLQKTAYERLQKARRQHLTAGRRSVEREIQFPDRSSRILARQVTTDSGPAQRLSRKETMRCVGEALAELSESDREILMMRSFEGLSYDEVAAILDIEPTAARKRYGRALLRLRKALAKRGLVGGD